MILGVTGHRGVHALPIARAFLSVWQPSVVITGMALGWDQDVAQACIDLGIPFRTYLPGAWQADTWPPAAQAYHECLLSRAAEVRIISKGPYSPAAMQIRNMAIVDDCEMLLAMWDGRRHGGTANCIDYARNRRATPRDIINLWSARAAPREALK